MQVVHEAKTYKRREERLRARVSRGQIIGGETPNPQETTINYDKAYYAIGILCVLAGGVKLSEFVLFVILVKQELAHQ